MVIIGVKRELEGELKSNDSKVRVIGECVYSKVDRLPKSYYRKKAEDLRQWELLGSIEDQAMSNTPDFSQRVLRSATKRAHANITTDFGRTAQSDDKTDAKRVKAMLALLEWFGDEGELNWEEEAAMIVSVVKHQIPILQSYKEAINDLDYGKQWKAVIDFEIGQLLANNTQEEKPCPDGVNLISSKQVFLLKFCPDGVLERFKARLVARGFTQQYRVDYTETFAPTVRMATMRAFFTIVAYEDLEYRQYDIKNVFTESKLNKELWMKLHQGVERIKGGTVLHLLRSLYGLK